MRQSGSGRPPRRKRGVKMPVLLLGVQALEAGVGVRGAGERLSRWGKGALQCSELPARSHLGPRRRSSRASSREVTRVNVAVSACLTAAFVLMWVPVHPVPLHVYPRPGTTLPGCPSSLEDPTCGLSCAPGAAGVTDQLGPAGAGLCRLARGAHSWGATVSPEYSHAQRLQSQPDSGPRWTRAPHPLGSTVPAVQLSPRVPRHFPVSLASGWERHGPTGCSGKGSWEGHIAGMGTGLAKPHPTWRARSTRRGPGCTQVPQTHTEQRPQAPSPSSWGRTATGRLSRRPCEWDRRQWCCPVSLHRRERP